jgi:hypothetical protein
LCSILKIQLFSITGQLIYTKTATNNCNLRIEHKGIYLLSIEELSGNNNFPTKKILSTNEQ